MRIVRCLKPVHFERLEKLVGDNKIIYLDGAMGTMLQRAGLETGHAPETMNQSDPAQIAAIHRAYLEAGAQIVYQYLWRKPF